MSSDNNNNNNTTNIPSSFHLQDLMNMGNNPAVQQQLQGLLNQQMTNHTQEPDEDPKEAARRKLRARIQQGEESRRGKSFQENKYVDELKKNPIVQRSGKNVDIDILVDQVMKQNNLPDHAKQRKAVRKQVEQLLNKL